MNLVNILKTFLSSDIYKENYVENQLRNNNFVNSNIVDEMDCDFTLNLTI